MMPRFVRRAKDYVKPIVRRFWRKLCQFGRAQWQIWGPRVDRIIQASIAISTATSTFKLSVEVIPIILSMLTVLATAPLLSGLLPAFVFDQTVIFFTIVGIAAIAGYHKFKELVLRAKLDAQIQTNTVQGKKFAKEIEQLNKRLIKLEKIEDSVPAACRAPSPVTQQTPAFKKSLNRQSRPTVDTPVNTAPTVLKNKVA